MDRIEDQIVLDNIPLVHFLIKTYYPTFIHDEDVIQSGRVGLILASKSYDPEKGTFANFASRCILNEISKEFRRRKHRNETLSLDYMTEDSEGEVTPLLELLSSDSDTERVDMGMMLEQLAPKEREVAELLLKGYTRNEIGKALGCTKQNVALYCRKIKLKWSKWYK